MTFFQYRPPVDFSSLTRWRKWITLHKLATNAAKHSALSEESGRVVIAWDVAAEAENGPWFLMSWRLMLRP